MIDTDHIIRFGKYKGKPIKEVVETDVSYLIWYVRTALNSQPSPELEKEMFQNIGNWKGLDLDNYIKGNHKWKRYR